MEQNNSILFSDDEVQVVRIVKQKQCKPEKRENVIKRLMASADIYEDDIEKLGHGEDFDSILELLLRDQSRGLRIVPLHIISDEDVERVNYKKYHHIVWATDNYIKRGDGYMPSDEINVSDITKKRTRVVRPRVVKSIKEQQHRIKQKAEVFTPAWVCNHQNNLVDDAWFGQKGVFNQENDDHTWTPTLDKIQFSSQKGHTWLDYVTERRMEMCCGEAPYIVSRYDVTTGELIPLNSRIGLLDRKLRIVGENATTLEKWREYAYKALRSIYAFEWQGDNLLIARENILVSFIEYYYDFCKKIGVESEISTTSLAHAVYIISWNIFQMDGLNYTIPYSDQVPEKATLELEFETQKKSKKIEGVFAKIARWTGDGRQKYLTPIEFREILKSN
jgi:hypothetical protein